jgi:hypothetical protein
VIPRGALLALLLAAPLAAAAQGRARRHLPAPRPPATSPSLRLLRAERASPAAARAALPAVMPAVARCLDDARALDPAGLAAARRIDVVLDLALDGHATAAGFDPPLRARGLSACLGGAFLAWRQRGVSHPRASLRLSLEL